MLAGLAATVVEGGLLVMEEKMVETVKLEDMWRGVKEVGSSCPRFQSTSLFSGMEHQYNLEIFI